MQTNTNINTKDEGGSGSKPTSAVADGSLGGTLSPKETKSSPVKGEKGNPGGAWLTVTGGGKVGGVGRSLPTATRGGAEVRGGIASTNRETSAKFMGVTGSSASAKGPVGKRVTAAKKLKSDRRLAAKILERYGDKQADQKSDQQAGTLEWSKKVLSDVGDEAKANFHFIKITFTYAIKEAIQWITSSKGKYVICTDSLATVTAIRNTSNSSPLISEIRDKLIDSRNKIIVMWIPGHCGIPGNELADKEAKNATLSPCIYVRTNESNDILRFVANFSKLKAKAEWYTYDNRYRLVNPELRKAVYSSTCSIPEIKIFTRLRLGHTILTHQHILDRNITPGCRLCNSPTNSVEHILNICLTFRHIRRDYVESYPSKLLKEPSTANIKEIYNFISRAQLKHLI
ncbi:uncharacterized protein [Bactrocera oleae]|uniref:uncharacterized protein n=1 Tax=Bactrocera oleae TaxID=104688 RepID=UPI00387EB69A